MHVICNCCFLSIYSIKVKNEGEKVNDDSSVKCETPQLCKMFKRVPKNLLHTKIVIDTHTHIHARAYTYTDRLHTYKATKSGIYFYGELRKVIACRAIMISLEC